MQQNLGTHVTTSGKVTELSNFFSLVSTQASDRLSESEAVTNATSAILASVTQAQTTIDELQVPDQERLDQLQLQNENLDARARATIEEVVMLIAFEFGVLECIVMCQGDLEILELYVYVFVCGRTQSVKARNPEINVSM